MLYEARFVPQTIHSLCSNIYWKKIKSNKVIFRVFATDTDVQLAATIRRTPQPTISDSGVSNQPVQILRLTQITKRMKRIEMNCDRNMFPWSFPYPPPPQPPPPPPMLVGSNYLTPKSTCIYLTRVARVLLLGYISYLDAQTEKVLFHS